MQINKFWIKEIEDIGRKISNLVILLLILLLIKKLGKFKKKLMLSDQLVILPLIQKLEKLKIKKQMLVI